MKISRFKGEDMRDTMRLVRGALGPEAVILETTKDEDGVEISAAVDFNQGEYRRIQAAKKQTGEQLAADQAREATMTSVETQEIKSLKAEVENIRCLLQQQLSQLVWNESARRSPEQAGVMRHLANLEVAPDIVARLLRENDDHERLESTWTAALRYLARVLVTTETDAICHGGTFAVVGPTGVGKTTTIAKLAARYALQNGHSDIAFVTTDNFRIAAREQLETFGQILGAPVYDAHDGKSLDTVLRSLSNKKLILIDTAGVGQNDMRLAEQLSCLTDAESDIDVLLALPANVQAESQREIVRSFSITKPSACILTKIDEAMSLGGAFSTMVRSELPLAYVTNGQRVPEDLHFAHPRRAWLVKSAVEMLNRRDEAVGEEYLAQNFGEVFTDECA